MVTAGDAAQRRTRCARAAVEPRYCTGMGSFVRIDGEEVGRIDAARLTWYPASAAGDPRGDGEHGLAFHLVAQGRGSILHVAGWAPAERPDDLSGQELTIDSPGPDAALDGRLFGALLIRFGRVTATQAVLSLDGEIEGFGREADARALVAADIVARVAADEIPAYCNLCGRSLADESVEHATYLGGRRVTSRSPPARCAECRRAEPLAPPRCCSTCGEEYPEGALGWQADERSIGYAGTCANGHIISGAAALED
jgi:hypothetical protein